MFLNVWLTMSRFIRNMKLLNIIDYRNSFVVLLLFGSARGSMRVEPNLQPWFSLNIVNVAVRNRHSM